MRTLVIFLFLSLSGNVIFAQADSIQQEIDEQVWIPFMESYSDFDAETYLSLHSDDLVRVTQDNGKIRNLEEYGEGILKWWPKRLAEGSKRKLELSFTQRIHNSVHAFDVGYYKVTYADKEESYYGHFHVLLRKIDSQWLIFMDADTNHDGTVGEADFQKGVTIN